VPHKHIYAQLIDDKTGHTLAFSSTVDKDVSKRIVFNRSGSFSVGQNLAKKSRWKTNSNCCF
jgi:ribosomal protein L18